MKASSRASEGQQSRAAAAGGTAFEKAVVHGNGGSIARPESCPFPVHSFLSNHSVSTLISRAYSCAFILRSRAVDPRRTASMVEKEEHAQQQFQEMKDSLPELSPRWWKKDFKHYIDKFIEECLDMKGFVAAIPCEDEEEEEQDRIYFHGLQCLVAGAVQEWELVQQPKHAAMCAKLDSALVWQGRGYVSQILHAISLFQPSLQS